MRGAYFLALVCMSLLWMDARAYNRINVTIGKGELVFANYDRTWRPTISYNCSLPRCNITSDRPLQFPSVLLGPKRMEIKHKVPAGAVCTVLGVRYQVEGAEPILANNGSIRVTSVTATSALIHLDELTNCVLQNSIEIAYELTITDMLRGIETDIFTPQSSRSVPLTPYIQYSVTAVVKNIYGYSNRSDEVIFRTQEGKPPPPTIVGEINFVSPTEFDVTIRAPFPPLALITGYDMKVCSYVSSQSSPLATDPVCDDYYLPLTTEYTSPNLETTHTVRGLVNNTSVRTVKVRTIGTTTRGKFSEQVYIVERKDNNSTEENGLSPRWKIVMIVGTSIFALALLSCLLYVVKVRRWRRKTAAPPRPLKAVSQRIKVRSLTATKGVSHLEESWSSSQDSEDAQNIYEDINKICPERAQLQDTVECELVADDGYVNVTPKGYVKMNMGSQRLKQEPSTGGKQPRQRGGILPPVAAVREVK